MKKQPTVMCSPTKYLSKCNSCHRRRAKVEKWQPCYNFYDECKDGKYAKFIIWENENEEG